MNNIKNLLDKNLEIATENLNKENFLKNKIYKLRQELNTLINNQDKLHKILIKENNDVEKLYKTSFANFFYSLTGGKADKIEKEKQEALEAKLNYDSVNSEIETTKTKINDLKKCLLEFGTAEKEYKDAYEAKKNYLIENYPDLWLQIDNLISEAKNIDLQLKEIEEAANAGQVVYTQLAKAREDLNKAENWGLYDMVGGGFIATSIKHSHMHNAQTEINKLKHFIKIFKKELEDVKMDFDKDINMESFLGFADYFFDGFLVDFFVQRKITKAQDALNNIHSQIVILNKQLTDKASIYNKRKREIKTTIKEIIENN